MDVQRDYSSDEPEKVDAFFTMPTSPLEAIAESASELDLTRETFPDFLVAKSSIKRFAVADWLPLASASFSRQPTSGRYLVSGLANAEIVLSRLLADVQALPANHTLAVDLSTVSATADFIHPIASQLFFPDSPSRTHLRLKQVVFFDPDYTTCLSLHHSLLSAGKANTNCFVARSIHMPRWELRIVGHLEPHLARVLDFARTQKSFTTKDVVDAGYSNHLANAAARTRELWDMGLIRRVKDENPLNKSGRREFRYTPYHPQRDLYPSYPVNLLTYRDAMTGFSPELGPDLTQR